MFVAILLSQFSPCPGITMVTDDVITTTDDVIIVTDDGIHTICIVLEGKVMYCNKVTCFYNNKFSTSNLFSGITHGNIDATIITQQQKNMLLVSFFIPKIISLKAGSWLQSCKMTGHEGTRSMQHISHINPCSYETQTGLSYEVTCVTNCKMSINLRNFAMVTCLF